MYHTIKLTENLTVDLEVPHGHRLEQMLLRKDTQLEAQIRPYVLETKAGLIETADLFLGDGTVILGIPFGCFYFVE